jgi:hypothetical protein
MLSLELVAHCWHYPRLACLFLSALALNPPRTCRAIVTICHAPPADDPATWRMLAYFAGAAVDNVRWNWLQLPAPEICRRAIGRNRAALASRADFVLFGDIDYIFGAGALDAAAAAMPAACANGPRLMFPREILASAEHVDGDAEIARVDPAAPALVDLAPERYVPVRRTRGIGGCQYVTGDFARKRGYLSDSRRFQRPSGVWVRTTCDTAFRRWAGLDSVPIEMPGVYRVRHSKRGRVDIGVEL